MRNLVALETVLLTFLVAQGCSSSDPLVRPRDGGAAGTGGVGWGIDSGALDGAGKIPVGSAACSDGVDNDGDGKVDYDDPECVGPLDNDEGSFATGIPGDNMDACKQDCFFDGNSGMGDDGCQWQLKCDPSNVGATAEKKCPYDMQYAAQHATECSVSASQSQHCVDSCRKLTPNGCDCFGCCVVPGATTPIRLVATCTAGKFGDPTACPACTQVTSCNNVCERCEICVGKATLPPDCAQTPDGGVPVDGGDVPPPPLCPGSIVSCGPGGQVPATGCPAGTGCLTGCCTPLIEGWGRGRESHVPASSCRLAVRVYTTVRRSLRSKLVRTMVAMLVIVASTTLVVVAGINYFSARATLTTIQSHLRNNIQRKGSDLVTGQALALRGLVDDNAFSDVNRLVERTVEQDDGIIYGLFLGNDLKPWGYSRRDSEGHVEAGHDWKELGIDLSGPAPRGVTSAAKTAFGYTVVEFLTPVTDDDGGYLGTVRYGVSDRMLQQALADARATSHRALLTTIALLLLLGALATALGTLLSRRAAFRITRPVSDLTTAVNALAQGRRDIRVSIESGDELEMLGSAFNHMVAELQDSYARLEEMNRALEVKVEERTRALAGRNRDMRLVLDNVDQGFLTLSPEGILAQERSAIVDRWFGPYGAGATFSAYMNGVDAMFAEMFGLGYDALLEGLLPRDLCLAQLPSRLKHQGREFRCTYFALGQGERLDGLLIVIDDITAQLLAARKEAERSEVLAMFESLTRDRSGLLTFVDESNEQLALLPTADLETQKRLLHTLKGNANLVGFDVMAGLCHKLEDDIADTNSPLPETSLEPLERRWLDLTKSLRLFLGDKGRDTIELPVRELDRLDEEIRAGAVPGQILDRLASWKLESAERPLMRLGSHARALASRFGKGDLVVDVDAGGVRLSSKTWGGLWSDLVHVIRNAVDHGIEPAAVRHQAGKPARPRLRLALFVVDRDLVLEIEDDGAGIDWVAVRAAAARRQLPHATEEDLVRALFSSDVTTRSVATSLSGRGIGLAAVRKQVEKLGGTVSVRSRPAEGTCFRFDFPLPEVGPRFGVEARERTVKTVTVAA